MNVKALLLLLPICGLQIAVAKSSGEKNQPRNSVISHIPHSRVTSSGIASIGYSKRRRILEIEFVNGAVYRYVQVGPNVYHELMTADSKARYYDANVRGKYLSLRVRPRFRQ